MPVCEIRAAYNTFVIFCGIQDTHNLCVLVLCALCIIRTILVLCLVTALDAVLPR